VYTDLWLFVRKLKDEPDIKENIDWKERIGGAFNFRFLVNIAKTIVMSHNRFGTRHAA